MIPSAVPGALPRAVAEAKCNEERDYLASLGARDDLGQRNRVTPAVLPRQEGVGVGLGPWRQALPDLLCRLWVQQGFCAFHVLAVQVKKNHSVGFSSREVFISVFSIGH